MCVIHGAFGGGGGTPAFSSGSPSYQEVRLMHIWHFLFPLLQMPPSGGRERSHTALAHTHRHMRSI